MTFLKLSRVKHYVKCEFALGNQICYLFNKFKKYMKPSIDGENNIFIILVFGKKLIFFQII